MRIRDLDAGDFFYLPDGNRTVEDAPTAKRDSIIEQPSNKKVKLWRYMSYAKLVSMLEHGGIFFPRLETLGDPFEGSFSRANVKYRQDASKINADLSNFLDADHYQGLKTLNKW